MLPTARPCQQPYYQSIMNLDDPCDAKQMASLLEYKIRVHLCVPAHVCAHVAGNLRKRLTQKAEQGM